MKIEIYPTQDADQLKENLEKRTQELDIQDEKIVAEIEEGEEEFLEYTPGIEKYLIDGDTKEGLKGRPVQEEAYAKLETKRDLARAVVATIQGYDLRILDTNQEWDLKILRRFNPDVKHLKMTEPKKIFEIKKTLDEEDSEREQVEIEMSEEEVEMVYRFAQFEGNPEQ